MLHFRDRFKASRGQCPTVVRSIAYWHSRECPGFSWRSRKRSLARNLYRFRHVWRHRTLAKKASPPDDNCHPKNRRWPHTGVRQNYIEDHDPLERYEGRAAPERPPALKRFQFPSPDKVMAWTIDCPPAFATMFRIPAVGFTTFGSDRR